LRLLASLLTPTTEATLARSAATAAVSPQSNSAPFATVPDASAGCRAIPSSHRPLCKTSSSPNGACVTRRHRSDSSSYTIIRLIHGRGTSQPGCDSVHSPSVCSAALRGPNVRDLGPMLESSACPGRFRPGQGPEPLHISAGAGNLAKMQRFSPDERLACLSLIFLNGNRPPSQSVGEGILVMSCFLSISRTEIHRHHRHHSCMKGRDRKESARL
jgi:hypothetical protein